MWNIETSGGLGQRRPTPNSWEKGKGEEDSCSNSDTIELYCSMGHRAQRPRPRSKRRKRRQIRKLGQEGRH